MATTKKVPEFPVPKKLDQTIAPTSFAGPYRSKLTLQAQAPLLELLKHVNCSYLSSPRHRAVTLLDLKQHAQALTVLIRQLCVSTTSGAINQGEFQDNEAFDWLNDLTSPYTNDDKNHNTSLLSLTNHLRHGLEPASEEGEPEGFQHICPMTHSDVRDVNRQHVLPFARHEVLAQHANEILERLDHEFGGYGGILGMLPMDGDGPEGTLKMGEKTLLGGLIAHSRALTLRLHELEIAYNNAIDIVCGEAAVPRAILDDFGAIAPQPEILTHRQNQFILCGIRNGELQALKQTFEEKEEGDGLGLMTWVELPTKYYRLKAKDAEKTIFILPQWEGTKTTRDAELRPTVVQVTKREFPARASLWEEKYKAEIKRIGQVEPQLWQAQRRIRELEDDVKVLAHEKKQLEMEKRIFQSTHTDVMVKEWVAGAMRDQERIFAEGEKWKKMNEELTKQKRDFDAMNRRANEEILTEKRKWREANTKQDE